MSTSATSLDLETAHSEKSVSEVTFDGPVITIEAENSFQALSPSHLWQYRELLYFLTWRELKVRYKQAVLGIAWVVVQPLMMTLTFTVVLGNLARVPSDGIPYPVFAYSGFMIWSFLSAAILNAGTSLVGNAPLITKVYFPRLILPVASIAARLVDLGVSFAIFLALLAYFRTGITLKILAVPLVIFLVTLLALAVGMWVAALNVKYRDVTLALPVLIQISMFLSPVVYPPSLIPSQWRWLYSLNPVVGILGAFRSVIFGLPFNWPQILVSVVITLSLLVYAAFVFDNRERTFADIV